MIKSTPQEQVVVRFTITEGDHSYSDALYFERPAYTALSDQELEAMQRARFENWLAVINAPRPEPEGPVVLSDEEYAQRIVDLCSRHSIDISAIDGNQPVVAMPYTNTVQEDYQALMAYLVANNLEQA